MNEAFADYTSEFVFGKEYYRQPDVSIKARQRFLIRGLDSSDREVGVFSSFGLTCIQPYAFVLEDYKLLTEHDLMDERSKYSINGELLPEQILKMVGKDKVRAQTGDEGGGILGHFVRNGIEEVNLVNTFCESFSCSKDFIRSFLNIGEYRT